MLRNLRNIPIRGVASFLKASAYCLPAASSIGSFKLAINQNTAKFLSTSNPNRSFCNVNSINVTQVWNFLANVLQSGTSNLLIREIDDLGKTNKSQDDLLRCKLAALYRLVDLKGWSWSVYNHITVIKLPWLVGLLLVTILFKMTFSVRYVQPRIPTTSFWTRTVCSTMR